MSHILFVAPASNLQTQAEILRAVQGQTIALCDGYVDRDKLEQFLRNEQYDIVHFAMHGDLSILQLSDGLVEVSELIAMLEAQRDLKLIVITACNSAGTGTEIHNKRNIPVVMCQAPIEDGAAIVFSERFYRSYRVYGDPQRAIDNARATLRNTHPKQADIVVLINGDMARHKDLNDCMNLVRDELGEIRADMNVRFASLESNVDSLGEQVKDVRNMQDVNRILVYLVGALLAAQVLTALVNYVSLH